MLDNYSRCDIKLCRAILLCLLTRQYHRIAALPFFKQYSQWKSFAEWKSFVRIRKRAKCRAVLEEDLFTLHPWLRIGESRDKQRISAMYISGRLAADSCSAMRDALFRMCICLHIRPYQ